MLEKQKPTGQEFIFNSPLIQPEEQGQHLQSRWCVKRTVRSPHLGKAPSRRHGGREKIEPILGRASLHRAEGRPRLSLV